MLLIQAQPDLGTNLVFAADGHSVDTVVIDGAVVLEHGHMLTIDEEAVMRELEQLGQSMLQRTGYRPQIAWPVIR